MKISTEMEEKFRREAVEAWKANRKLQEAMTRKQRFEDGEFSIELVRTDDDPSVNDPVFQNELRGFGADLHSTGLRVGQRAVAMDSAEAIGFSLPEFILAIKDLGEPAIHLVFGLAGAWLYKRYGRKVRLKIGDIEAEASSVEEVKELLQQAEKFKPVVQIEVKGKT